jgi:hypothetical protein
MTPLVTVTLFLPTGRTFTFKDATIIGDTEAELHLAYTAQSDGALARLRVRKDAIVAFSTKEQ